MKLVLLFAIVPLVLLQGCSSDAHRAASSPWTLWVMERQTTSHSDEFESLYIWSDGLVVYQQFSGESDDGGSEPSPLDGSDVTFLASGKLQFLPQSLNDATASMLKSSPFLRGSPSSSYRTISVYAPEGYKHVVLWEENLAPYLDLDAVQSKSTDFANAVADWFRLVVLLNACRVQGMEPSLVDEARHRLARLHLKHSPNN